MKDWIISAIFVTGVLACSACTDKISQDLNQPAITPPSSSDGNENMNSSPFNRNSRISDVMSDSVFGNYGRLLFPVQRAYWSGETLEDLRLIYYNNIDPDKTVEITNYLYHQAMEGNKIFYDIYTDEEKAQDPAKRDTGLFFFRGNRGSRFAVCNAGGAFAYVGAMHDSFPHALELSKKGYNAFALIYRPGAQTACEDLARAISFIFAHADELDVDTSCYSLWGGSAGGRMAAWVSGYGTEAFGGDNLPKAGAAIIQYTGLSDFSQNDVPTYSCVGDKDGIASWRTMKARLDGMSALGIPTEFHVYEGLSHGFGLGTGTAAEGWIKDAIRLWENQMPDGGNSSDNGGVANPTVSGIAPMKGTVNLWYKGHIPANTQNANNSDGPDFIPNVEVFTVNAQTTPKGAVVICPGGAFAFRSIQNEGYDVANMLTTMGYQCFVVNYRIRPYTMQESAVDLQRAIRYVRAHASDYRINPENIALVGFSAGGILNGEVLLNWRDLKNASSLVSGYQPDELDQIPVRACAVGMIYSFYGRLSVSMNNVATLRSAYLPPAFYCWGTRDGFAGQFTQNSNAVEQAGCTVVTHILQNYPHGYGTGGNASVWGNDFDAFLTPIMQKNIVKTK